MFRQLWGYFIKTFVVSALPGRCIGTNIHFSGCHRSQFSRDAIKTSEAMSIISEKMREPRSTRMQANGARRHLYSQNQQYFMFNLHSFKGPENRLSNNHSEQFSKTTTFYCSYHWFSKCLEQQKPTWNSSNKFKLNVWKKIVWFILL